MPAASHRLHPTESHWSFRPEWKAATLISSRLVPQQLSIDKYIIIFILEVCNITCLWSVLICLTDTSWIVQAALGKPSCASAISRTVVSVWCPPEGNSRYLLKFHRVRTLGVTSWKPPCALQYRWVAHRWWACRAHLPAEPVLGMWEVRSILCGLVGYVLAGGGCFRQWCPTSWFTQMMSGGHFECC